MHSFLRSIGFSNIKKEELMRIMEMAYQKPDAFEMAIDTEGSNLAEVRIEVAKNIGLAMRGTIDEADEFSIEYYFPYCINFQTLWRRE